MKHTSRDGYRRETGIDSPVQGGGHNIDLWGGLRGCCPPALSFTPGPPVSPAFSHPLEPRAVPPLAPSHPRVYSPGARDVVGVTLVACWSSPQPPTKSWWEPEAATGGRDSGEGDCSGDGGGGGGLCPISWGTLLALISRR